MPCYRPIKGFKGVSGGISWTPRTSYRDVPMEVPCGQCIGCRLERSRQWAVRIMHECSLYESNLFLTLTYSDEHLPHRGVLVKRHFQLFMKRLRKHFANRLIRFYHCGEYGSLTQRPHYHAILFNVDFPDRVLHSKNGRGESLYESATLAKLWPYGQATYGEVTFESAAYCARYCVKKVTGQLARFFMPASIPRLARCTSSRLSTRPCRSAARLVTLVVSVRAGWISLVARLKTMIRS